jgi:hypothetical protein
MNLGFAVPGPVGNGVGVGVGDGVGVGVGVGEGVGVGVGVGAGATVKLWLPELDPFPPAPLSVQLQVRVCVPAVNEATVAEQESPCCPGVLHKNAPSRFTVALSLSTGGTFCTFAVNVTGCPAIGADGFSVVETVHS